MTFRYSDSFNDISSLLKTKYFWWKISNIIWKADEYKDKHGKYKCMVILKIIRILWSYLKLSKGHRHKQPPTMKTTIYSSHTVSFLPYTTWICWFNTSSDLTEPKTVDQKGHPQHCRLWQILQRSYHFPVRQGDLGCGTQLGEDCCPRWSSVNTCASSALL